MKHGALAGADKKFYFHMNNFDDEVIEEEVIEEEDLPPPPPMFTEAQLEAAKKAAFAEGHAQGKKEAEESRAQALSMVLQQLGVDAKTLFEAESAREATYEREAVELCKVIFEQTFPITHEKHGFEELTDQLKAVVSAQHGQSAIEIRVSDDYAQGVEAFMEKLKSQDSDLNFSVTNDESLSSGSFKLGWKDGGAIYNAEAIAQKVLGKLDETLAGGDTTSHDSIDKDSQEAGMVSDVANTAKAEDAKDDHSHDSTNPIAEENNE